MSALNLPPIRTLAEQRKQARENLQAAACRLRRNPRPEPLQLGKRQVVCAVDGMLEGVRNGDVIPEGWYGRALRYRSAWRSFAYWDETHQRLLAELDTAPILAPGSEGADLAELADRVL